MTTKCSLADDMLVQARITLAVSMPTGVVVGLLLVLFYWVMNRYILPRCKQSNTTNYAPTPAVKIQALQPPRRYITNQTSNSTTTSGVSDDQGERNNRYQQSKPMLPKLSGPKRDGAQQRGWSRAPAPSPEPSVSYKNKPPHNYNSYSNQHDDESDMYVNFNQPQMHDEENPYLVLDGTASTRQYDSDATYSNTNRRYDQLDDDATYANVPEPCGTYDSVTMPYVGHAVANQAKSNKEYLSMGQVPPRPPR